MEVKDRKPAVAGMFYDKDSASLNQDLERLFRQAHSPVSSDDVAAVIAPHAGYVFSGEVAASAFNQIRSDAKYERVFLIGSSHRVAFEGASIYANGDFITPMGKVEIDADLCNQLAQNSSVISNNPTPHLEEHSLEVELPFLQYHLKHSFKLVPIIMGPHDASGARKVADELKPWFNEKNLFVISTDFSHYPAYEDAKRIDGKTANSIVKNDPSELLKVLEENNRKKVDGLATSLCGWTSVLTLLYLTHDLENIEYKQIEYKNSGDADFGDKNKVVGYHAIGVFRNYDTKTNHSDFTLNKEEKEWLLRRSRQALEAAVEGRNPEQPQDGLSNNLKTQTGAFVSLYKDGKLRGCIGNFGHEIPLWKVVDQMTASAALNDSRFTPVSPKEVDDINIEISVLTPMQEIDDVSKIIPGKHGILVRKGSRSGTFLPQVATKTGWNREELLGHCSRDKAGLPWDGWKDASIFVYEALVFAE